jgi:hypothetical protein
MSTRERLTWKQGGERTADRLPVEEADRKASAHPAIPDEGITHPAGYPDPEQPAAYENGDTSSWAEDPTKGPYPNSAHPATPDEGPFHPAAKKAAQELRAAVERKALKCLRIATATLGKGASIKEIEAQSLSMMDLPDAYIDSTLSRLAKKSEDTEEEAAESIQEDKEEKAKEEKEDKKASHQMSADDQLLRRLLAEEDMGDDKDEGADKEASSDKAADDRLAAIESSLAAMTKELQAMRGMNVAQDPEEAQLAQMLAEDEGMVEGMDDDEALLAQMLEDEMSVVVDDDEALLAQMLEDEMAPVVDESVILAAEEDKDEGKDEEAADKEAATLGDFIGDAEMEVSMTASDDPMGLGGGDDLSDAAVLANLYTAKKAEDDEDEDSEDDDEDEGGDEDAEEAEEEAEDDKEGGKKKAAARKPRPKKASGGARTVGQPTFDKTASREINDLANLWKTAPDVSEAF